MPVGAPLRPCCCMQTPTARLRYAMPLCFWTHSRCCCRMPVLRDVFYEVQTSVVSGLNPSTKTCPRLSNVGSVPEHDCRFAGRLDRTVEHTSVRHKSLHCHSILSQAATRCFHRRCFLSCSSDWVAVSSSNTSGVAITSQSLQTPFRRCVLFSHQGHWKASRPALRRAGHTTGST